MEQDIRACLPESVLVLWEQIDALDRVIEAYIEGEASEELGIVTGQRSAALRTLCEEIARLADVRLREQLLARLLDENTRLYARGAQALSDAGVQSATGALQRRAIRAYGVQESSS